MSNGICLLAMTLWLSQVAPPSKERVKAMVFSLKSFHATYTSPFFPTNGCAPIPNPGPLLLSIRVAVKVAPWSLDRARRMPPPLDPPSAASQAIYTLSRNGDPGFVVEVVLTAGEREVRYRRIRLAAVGRLGHGHFRPFDAHAIDAAVPEE